MVLTAITNEEVAGKESTRSELMHEVITLLCHVKQKKRREAAEAFRKRCTAIQKSAAARKAPKAKLSAKLFTSAVISADEIKQINR
jgi:hypothetical protein